MKKIKNKEIVKALNGAVNFLARSDAEIEDDFNPKDAFICRSIETYYKRLNWPFLGWTNRNQKQIERDEKIEDEVKKIIHLRIHPYPDVKSWLQHTTTIPTYQLTWDNLQVYRHAWLQELIKEFSNKES